MVGKVVDTVSSAVKKQKDKKKINPTNDNHWYYHLVSKLVARSGSETD
jgi:hypothetical protein